MKRRLFVASLSLAFPASVFGADHFFIIGGGADPTSSEAQIEFNVNWVVGSLKDIAPDASVTVFFADGGAGAKTAVELVSRTAEPAPPLDPLASVYGADMVNRLRFRPHRVAGASGSTRSDELIPRLETQLSALKPGDQAMIVYNGHGSWERDPADNALRLWDGTYLSARRFEALLGAVDTMVPVRYVLTQCYSGAFARAVHHDAAEHALELAKGIRCGFLAESEDRESEGCSASVELGDYRDYTTYFFSALTGKDRLGQPVTRASDYDGDGKVTPFDAHLHTLLEGYNGDLPRSTSEDFLERWQPWYVRWVGTGMLPQNVYGDLARSMAKKVGLPEDGRALGAALERSYKAVVDSNDIALDDRAAREDSAEAVRESIRSRIEMRWPELGFPYTAAHRTLLNDSLAVIEQVIRADGAYAALQAQQSALDAIELRLIDLDRRISQLDKLRRTRMLARALDQLERRGRSAHREAYHKLRACEALSIN